MRRRYRSHKHNNSDFCVWKDQNPDENEVFIHKLLCKYLIAIVGRINITDSNFLEIFITLLGEQVLKLAEDFEEVLRPDMQLLFQEEMREAGDDLEGIADIFAKGISSSSPAGKRKFLKMVKNVLAVREEQLSSTKTSQLEENIKVLSGLLGLSQPEIRLLSFLVVTTFSTEAETYFIMHLRCHQFSRRNILAAILGLTRGQVEGLFQGRLAQLELFDHDRHIFDLSENYRKIFESPDAKCVPGSFFKKAESSPITLDAYPIEKQELEYLEKIMKNNHESPNHILFYGPPGTGKTSFARRLASETTAISYEILHTEENCSKKRRVGISACSNMLKNNDNAVIIVDEADNVLNTVNSWFDHGEVQDKGWLNSLMEEDGPTFLWIVNRISGIEPSVLRRFAFSIQFKEFGVRERISVINSVLDKQGGNGRLSKEQIKKLAADHRVNAGPIDTAVNKAMEIGASDKDAFYKAVSISLGAHECLLDRGTKSMLAPSMEKTYDISGLNIDGDFSLLMRQLQTWAKEASRERSRFGLRLMFYGPPGTGKSESAKYIANLLELELHLRTASDIISPYIGETEQNIRKVFENAIREEAILVFDEADTFLFPRGKAQRSWEISFTNEFLTQMERFSGILICTTNRFSDMDEASVRRFTHKLHFGYLKPEANLIFYKRILSPLCSGKVTQQLGKQIQGIQNLAPGDFASVKSRYGFLPKTQVRHQELTNALKEESSIKMAHAGKTIIGFNKRQ
ncbi:AAA ATPase central domain protein [Desulfatibacillum aliphaticivorans]|uniref:AAA ATPase central domain protein n=1 Tax=Desulfatibacillum aliphaticivorans TaxID=218208 RepID=B8FD53_DESAL|nr:ATP-binding protein [Desulfatibacillum aliphaticivorans]ACL06484.1 AAA ATPase central domain protein [Desulfatibacillum aliphaticivorans]